MGITNSEARKITKEFTTDYPRALEVSYKFRNTRKGLFPNDKDTAPIKGSYIPKIDTHNGKPLYGQVGVVLWAIDDANDMRKTLRHEVFAHHGLNTFASDEKRAFLGALIESSNEPVIVGLWNKVKKHYKDDSSYTQAEEVIALYVEKISPESHIGRDKVHQLGHKSFRETCTDRTRNMQIEDLHNIVCMLAQGMHDRTREQKTFPTLQTIREQETADKERDNLQGSPLFKVKTTTPKRQFHEEVAEKLIEQLKAGTAPWQKPWTPTSPAPNMTSPRNVTTGNRYQGINALHLMLQLRNDPRWMTYKQAETAGAQVRRGSKGVRIQFWKSEKEQDLLDGKGQPVRDTDGKKIKEQIKLKEPRTYIATVFNAEQIDGLPPLEIVPQTQKQQWESIATAEQILKSSGANIRNIAGDNALYLPSKDTIILSEKSQFENAGLYYATALHELGHWTGHESRLDRGDMFAPRRSKEHAREELRAEISSMMVGDALGIGHNPDQHVSYVESWIQGLKNHPKEIYNIASDAEKIYNFVLSFQKEQQTQEATVEQREQVNNEANVKNDEKVVQLLKDDNLSKERDDARPVLKLDGKINQALARASIDSEEAKGHTSIPPPVWGLLLPQIPSQGHP